MKWFTALRYLRYLLLLPFAYLLGLSADIAFKKLEERGISMHTQAPDFSKGEQRNEKQKKDNPEKCRCGVHH